MRPALMAIHLTNRRTRRHATRIWDRPTRRCSLVMDEKQDMAISTTCAYLLDHWHAHVTFKGGHRQLHERLHCERRGRPSHVDVSGRSSSVLHVSA